MSAPSRREFLAGAAGAATVWAVGGAKVSAAPAIAERVVSPAEAALSETSFSTVVMAQDSHLVPARIVQRGLLRTFLDRVVAEVAGEKEIGAAWRKFLSDDDHILIKFNRSMSTLIGTTSAMAETMVASLTKAGFDPGKIILLEVDPEVREKTKTRIPDHRWQGKVVEFGAAGKDSFRADVDWATAIINVPFLKTHHRAVMTGCLKNLSHGLIRHPARFHGDGCAPGISEINACEDLRSRLKLNIVNGLRMNFDGGADGSENEIANAGLLLAGVDPVSCDTIGFRRINQVRSERGLGPILPGPTLPRQLELAASRGVGIANPERIELQPLE
ncbi:MAG TPA: DUF362 domain-containing protein [Phycisphaerae bacterium]|nr:DUF362 domain-containing protein [Phycisphaerae bacterium]HRW55222.1 DUF362 domain-containing protein [Phycisphaerae bacterium]